MKVKNKLKKLVVFGMLVCGTVNAQQWGDYTLYSIMGSNSAYLLDTNGTVFHTWTFPTANKSGYSTYMLPGGSLVRAVSKTGNSFSGGPICGQVQKVDYNGTITWDFIYSTTAYCSHHDICPMPNGNVLLIAYEAKTAAEVTQAGGSQNIVMWPDKIVEIQPIGATTGTVVWEWHAWDHLVQNVNPSKDNYQTSIVDHPELLNINYKQSKDWMHMNGVNYNPILDQITFSSHNLNEIYVIDHSTTTVEAAGHTGGNSGKGGDILYRWGNPAAYGAAGTAVINIVHDAHWIPEGVPNAGRLVGFNNKGVSSNQSAVDQVEPPVNGYTYSITPGSAYLPLSYAQRHACNGYTSNMGNSQQLPNGNMLVCIALSGNIYEVDPNGTTIWTKTVSGSCPKAFRYDACYLNNPAPAIPVITQNGNDLDAGTATTYQWYLNGALIAGATGQTYTPTQNGMYVVRITDSNGCVFRYSTGFNYQSATGIHQAGTKNNFSVYPNPSTGLVKIDGGNFGKAFEVKVIDDIGNTLMQKQNTRLFDISNLDNGIYFISISSEDSKTVTQKITLVK